MAAHPCTPSGDAVGDVVPVEVALAGEGKDLVLRPLRPQGVARLAVERHHAAEARLLAAEVDVADAVGDVVPVGAGAEWNHDVQRVVASYVDHASVALGEHLMKEFNNVVA